MIYLKKSKKNKKQYQTDKDVQSHLAPSTRQRHTDWNCHYVHLQVKKHFKLRAVAQNVSVTFKGSFKSSDMLP